MRNNQSKGKKKPVLIHKPYQKGRAVSALAAKRGLKVLVYQIALVFIFLFIGQMLLVESAPLRIVLNLLVVLGFFMLMVNEGSRAGLDDVAYAQIALNRTVDGKPLDDKDLARCYHPLKGVFTVVLGMLPLIIIALVFSAIAREQVYTLGGLPSWVQGYERRADVGLALSYYHETSAIGLEAILRIVIRLLLFPYVNMAGTDAAGMLLTLERLSPLLILIIPMGYAVGYLRGPALRAQVHGAISTDAKRRKRREKKAIVQRKEPRNLV